MKKPNTRASSRELQQEVGDLLQFWLISFRSNFYGLLMRQISIKIAIMIVLASTVRLGVQAYIVN